jgi:EAL domain-containing protein (putative c-di-GMP-specific phosphodiesterase class I)
MVEEQVTSRSSERPGADAGRAPISAAAHAPAGWGAAFDAAVLAVVDDPGRHHFVHQPIVDLSRGVITGYEMLSRFSGADATPDQWFAAADRLGVGAALQVRVLRHGVAQLASLPPDTFLTINLDPRLIAHDEVVDCIDGVASMQRLVIELTEQSVADDSKAMLALLDRARSAGAIVALDDVGAGYSGLQALLAVRPQIVKLDRSLVSGIDRDPARRALAEMLGEFMGRLDAWVLAEGIETLGELRAVIDLGVPLGQGYALGRPAAGFAPQLADEPRQVIANRAGARVFVETLAPLVETVPIASSVDDARAMLRGDPALYHIVLVDGDERVRPVGLLSRAQAFEPSPVPSQPLCALMSEPADEVARRAMAREVDQRFDPVVCRDARGRYQGIVTIERLVERLTDGRAPV